jgi:hypothetical protein
VGAVKWSGVQARMGPRDLGEVREQCRAVAIRIRDSARVKAAAGCVLEVTVQMDRRVYARYIDHATTAIIASSKAPSTVAARPIRRRLTLPGWSDARESLSRFGVIAWYGGSSEEDGTSLWSSLSIPQCYACP